ncbi:RsmD family RNA methyltransferase [Candidatus Saccharibacteria bacterium]|nr:RsmD family RNA methyltransferase [Candidatus Saccharibacteria bacterium]MBR3332098.1 RsmD family RNA methyltransferase [Candidatus Saccharibacteria bacterium]
MFRKKKNTQPGGEVRIISGEYKGRKIKTPGGNTHPMGERERNAIFNAIGDQIYGAFVMDLYAGSGAIGIEALSRGANFVLFIDKDPRAVDTINENLRNLGISPFQGGAIQSDINLAARTATDRYPIVIADPPYDEYDPKIAKSLARLLSPYGALILSHPGEPVEIKGLKLLKTSKYANCHISFYQKMD